MSTFGLLPRWFVRILQAILVTVGSLVILVIVAIVVAFNYGVPDREDTFYLADAEPLDPAYLSLLDRDPDRSYDRQRFGFWIHRLKPGRGMILAYRFYSDGAAMVIDDEHYRKLTVWIPAGAPPSRAEFRLPDPARVLVMYSGGGSAWPRADCSGYVSRGALVVEPIDGLFKVSLRGESDPLGNTDTRCAPEQVKVEFEARAISFRELTPWLGLAGDNPYSETYRPRQGAPRGPLEMSAGAMALIIGGTLTAIAAVAHLACILLGARAYRFMGAGERMARAVEAGSVKPTIVTLAISAILLTWSVYAFSGAGVLGRLPFTGFVLAAISWIYFARAIGFPLLKPRFPENSMSFWMWSSGICLVLGLLYAFGSVPVWFG